MEICTECGISVKLGSGNFVNRIPDCNTPEDRKEMGKAYPEGEWICAECVMKGEYIHITLALEFDTVNTSLSTLAARSQRIAEIEESVPESTLASWVDEIEAYIKEVHQ